MRWRGMNTSTLEAFARGFKPISNYRVSDSGSFPVPERRWVIALHGIADGGMAWECFCAMCHAKQDEPSQHAISGTCYVIRTPVFIKSAIWLEQQFPDMTTRAHMSQELLAVPWTTPVSSAPFVLVRLGRRILKHAREEARVNAVRPHSKTSRDGEPRSHRPSIWPARRNLSCRGPPAVHVQNRCNALCMIAHSIVAALVDVHGRA